ncbi:helix-turn-helix domain-containing protein [Gloeocapsopsis dulcis]|uniref:Helix-turn-helix domain-containing protein n=1 Tax=Gloeocapsopsis dulcis AAB1 = 1H9 TaxID=1433147 RepID=A0A6N8G2H2_9CHRO|nr:helix-turn-helix domain-containing protein [Gloeocapsopsis dulcis]MUL39533.1 hypothetical protein [Gloeocapsopsis dulcis AAB1 = 1H9]WNN92155.1 helix-turn-helix domain-containing protein [Gloeocapsopsis dulcis]
MSETAIKEKRELRLFVPSDLDDYGLNPFEFRLYARICRRAGKDGKASESVPNMAAACHITVNRARKVLQLLEQAGLIESIERPGNSTLRRPRPQSEWVQPQRLQELRSLSTSAKNNRGNKNSTSTKLDSTLPPKLTPLPLSNLTDEGIPSKGNPNKVSSFPPLTPQHEPIGEEIEKTKQVVLDNEARSPLALHSAQSLSEHLTQLVQSTLVPIFSSLVVEAKMLLAEAVQSASPRVSRSKVRNKDSTRITHCPSPLFTHVLEELAILIDEPVENLQANSNLSAALEQYPDNVEGALLYFKQALVTWKNKPGLGLFISAVRKGSKPSPTKPGGGWKEWADEAVRRCLMEYSQAYNGDIAIYFVNGAQRLWSEVRNLSWSEIEAIAQTNCLEPNVA